MCGIIATKSITKLIELIKLNQQRGSFSHSLTVLAYNEDYTKLSTHFIYRQFGEFNFKLFDDIIKNNKNIKNLYFIAHVQAPTGGLIKDKERIHPSNIFNKQYLYHNGILKSKYVNNYKILLNENEWDTSILNNNIYMFGFDHLSEVKGSFACILLKDDDLYVFRNNNSILYFDNNLNFSSVKFENSFELESGEVFKLDLHYNCLINHHQFKLLDDYFVEI
jgi:glutamine phosphoribosylpyrophosphate amidotransferase